MQYEMRQTGYQPTRRILLVVLLIVSLVLAIVYGREGDGGPLHAVQNTVMNVSGQATGTTAGIAAMGEATGVALGDATADPATLSALREQNEQLRELLADADEYRQEVDRLHDLLDMKKVSGVTGPVARIIGRSTNAWDQSVTIDVGSNDDVRSGMTVMGATGVIGQISRTTADTSTVRLLTDPNSGAAVMIQSSRENGIVRGSINSVLYLEDLNEDVIPEVGDVVITSGMGGSYERGLIVGSIVGVNKTVSNPTGTVIVNPNDSASVLEEVIVVKDAPDVAAAEKAAEKAKAEAEAQAQAEAEAAQAEADAQAAYEEAVYYEDSSGYDGGY